MSSLSIGDETYISHFKLQLCLIDRILFGFSLSYTLLLSFSDCGLGRISCHFIDNHFVSNNKTNHWRSLNAEDKSLWELNTERDMDAMRKNYYEEIWKFILSFFNRITWNYDWICCHRDEGSGKNLMIPDSIFKKPTLYLKLIHWSFIIVWSKIQKKLICDEWMISRDLNEMLCFCRQKPIKIERILYC